jgi:carbamoyltransferase
MSSILGISAGFHDAAISLVSDQGDILFAGHAERYSKVKNDPYLNLKIMDELSAYAPATTVSYYERPWAKQLRQWYSGQGIEWDKLDAKRIITDQLGGFFKFNGKVQTYNHHLSHAAAGFQTSPFTDAVVVVCDAIGEWDTATIWQASYDREGRAQYKKLWGQKYPHSLGLFYSAMTKRIGLKPNEDEYILMGMAGWGKPVELDEMYRTCVDSLDDFTFNQNFHAGVDSSFLSNAKDEDIAATTQALTEWAIRRLIEKAHMLSNSRNLVYMGGVALNCSANAEIGHYFTDIWIMPNPGDAGSSLGAAALAYGKKLNWKDAFLGHDIPGPYPVTVLLDELITNKIVGVASGRAEFGPRALGNRSLLADPRGAEIKDRVNEIKRRQKFRPFAPVIMEEHVDDYFDMPTGWRNSRYMQTVARCRNPDLYPAIVHVDGTSRVQTVPRDDTSGIRKLLEHWYVLTGCPMLLNTSLNIKGEPMVNDRADADRFEQRYGVRVCS